MELIEGVNARICTKCGTLKRFEEFDKHKKSKYGIRTVCKECRKDIRKENKDKKNKINEIKFIKYINNTDYKIVGNYINDMTKIKIECPNGHIINTTPLSLKNNLKCDQCKIENKKEKLRIELIKILELKNHKLVEKYIDEKTKLKIICEKGHQYEATPREIKKGKKCPTCKNNNIKKILKSKQKFYEMAESEGYTIIGEYRGDKTKIELICPNGHNYFVRPGAFKNLNNRCPHCSESRGEKTISKILNKLNIDYISQFGFNNLKYKQKLRFDFMIIIKNKIALIEYDGIQHFEPINFTGKKNKEELLKQFEIIKLRDKLKNEYCKKNNIPLLRIPYTFEINEIEEKINKFIKELEE